MYDRQKSRVREDFESGIKDLGWIAADIAAGQIVQNGCMRRTTEVIDYQVSPDHNASNLCIATRKSELIGTPASHGSFGTYAVKGWIDARGEPHAEVEPSKFMYCRHSGSPVVLDQQALLERLAQKRFNCETEVLAGGRPEEHMNVLQAVCELKDTKDTIRPLCDFYTWCKKAVKSGRKVPVFGKVAKKLTLASSCATMASAYLWYSFGVSPTIDDVKRFCKELSEGKLRATGLKKRGYRKGEMIKARYRVSHGAADITQAMYGPDFDTEISFSRAMTMYHGTSYYSLVPRVPCWARPVIDRVYTGCMYAKVVEDFEFELDDMTRRFLWNCPIGSTMWELLPFSFLVDWFVNVGEGIKLQERRNTLATAGAHLSGIWHCAKTQDITYWPTLERYDVSVDECNRTETGGELILHLGAHFGYRRATSETGFNRSPWQSVPYYYPSVSREVHAYQISTGMALLAQAAFG